MMDKKENFKNWALPLLFALVSVISMFVGMRLEESLASDGYISPSKGSDHLAIYEASEHIRSKYYGAISDSVYVDEVVKGMVGQLDPYSRYFTEESTIKYDRYIDGLYQGLGLEFVVYGDTCYVYDVIDNSPADLADIKAGEIILFIDDVQVSGVEIDQDSLVRLTQKLENEKIILNVVDSKLGETRSLELVVSDITIPLIDDYIIASDSNEPISYVELKRFYGSVYRDFMEVLEGHKNKLGHDVKKLIIDLRDNPGGVVEETVKILNQLVNEKDKLLLTTRSKVDIDKSFTSNGRGFLSLERIVILCNANSASASEILAGVLQDYDKAVIIGENTYGKGLIQQNYNLSNQASINLSIGEYILPTGRSIYSFGKNDSTYTSLFKGRPLFSEKGITVDIPIEVCRLDGDEIKGLKEFVIENEIWSQQNLELELTENPQGFMSSLKTTTDSCSIDINASFLWNVSKQLTEPGEIISERYVDVLVEKAVQLIRSDQYHKTLTVD